MLAGILNNVYPHYNYVQEGSGNMNTTLFDNVPVAIYSCDRLGYITSFNNAAVKLWGRTPELGKDRWCGSWKIYQADGKLLLPEDYPIARALRDGIVIEGEELIIQRPDGTRSYVMSYPVPTFSAMGRLTGAVNTLADISSQKADEAKQAVLAAIIESSEDSIISKTLDGIIISWNRAAERMFGYKETEALGKHISILIPADRLDEEDVIISKIRNGKTVDHFETIRLTSDGRKIPISLTVSPIKDKRGYIIGASKIARDISRQKEEEEKLQRYAKNMEILNNLGKAISEDMDVQEILQKVSDASTQLTRATFGAFFYNKRDEKGEPYLLYALSGVPEETFEKTGIPPDTTVFSTAFSGQGILRVDDVTKYPGYGKNEPHKWMPYRHLPVISYLVVPVISKSGTLIGGLFYGHPKAAMFTEEHEALVSGVASQAVIALDNAMLYEEIKTLNAKKDEFIGLASHELKTPVTSLNGYLQILEGMLPEGKKERAFVSKARQQVGRLTALISDLLDVSKIQTGKLPLSFSRFDLLELLTEVTELVQYTSSSHHIEFNCDIETVMVYADRQRIEQVVINLLSNAIKYSPKADRVIMVLSADGSKVTVGIRDFGIGIDLKQQERIFSRFYRVEDLASHMSGLGIGLYISKEIINRHQGNLSVQSEPGKGSLFFFEMPLQQ